MTCNRVLKYRIINFEVSEFILISSASTAVGNIIPRLVWSK
jgi:hypothetical protein